MENIFGKNIRYYWMGVAITLIILCHIQCTCIWDGIMYKVLKFLFKNGDCGVEIFLLISVYGLCYSYTSNSLKTFYKRRLQRIFPLYLLFLFIALFYYNPNNIITGFIKQITGYYLFAGNSFNEWYIPALIWIYVFFPLLFKLVKLLYEYNNLYCYILILVLVFSYWITSDYLVLYFARRLYIPIIAIYIYLSKLKCKNYLPILIFTASLQLFTPLYWGNYLFLPLLLYSIDQIKHQNFLNSTFVFLGKYSLEIYLGQTVGIIYYCSSYHYDGRLKLICGLLITICISFILHYFQKGFYKLFKI